MTWLVRHEIYPWWIGHGRQSRYTLTRYQSDAVPFPSREAAEEVAARYLHYTVVDTEDTADAVDARGCA